LVEIGAEPFEGLRLLDHELEVGATTPWRAWNCAFSPPVAAEAVFR
jgi:hypothetical protein